MKTKAGKALYESILRNFTIPHMNEDSYYSKKSSSDISGKFRYINFLISFICSAYSFVADVII